MDGQPAAADTTSQASGRAAVRGTHQRNLSDASFQSAAHGRTDSDRRKSADKGKGKEKEKDGKGRWLHKMTDWLTVGEPSGRALKHHKKDVFRKAGISTDDKDAGRKLHVSVGEIPPDAIRPAKGPVPEEVFRRQVEERKKAGGGKPSRSQGSSVIESQLSQCSSGQSSKTNVENPIFPFD